MHVFYTFYNLNKQFPSVSFREISILLQSTEQLASFTETIIILCVLLHKIEVFFIFEGFIESNHHGVIQPSEDLNLVL